jgi:hypothetical protein
MWTHFNHQPLLPLPKLSLYHSDGTGNNTDADDDGDGYTDVDETTGSQSNPLDASSTPLDTDGDFISNLNDTDDDNDGVLDTADAFPLDANETLDTDTDRDGVGGNAD